MLQYYSLAASVKAHEDKCNKSLPDKYAKIVLKHSEVARDLSSIEQEYQAQVRHPTLMVCLHAFNTATCAKSYTSLHNVLDCLQDRHKFCLTRPTIGQAEKPRFLGLLKLVN